MPRTGQVGLLRRGVRAVGMYNIGLAGTIALLAVVMSVKYEYFLTRTNLEVAAMGFVLEAIMALGMTLVIISGGIDLSVGAVLPFSAILAGLSLGAGLGVVPAVVLAIVAAGVIGFANAGMAILFRVHPFIATLATMLTLKGVNLVITGGATVSGFPDAFCAMGQGRLRGVGVPIPLVIFAVLAVVIGYCLKNHRFFQQVYFVGGNPRAARTSGIKVTRFLLFVYVLSGALAGLAGVIAAAQYGSANNTFGQNAELRVIAAVVIGGASLFGGVGTIFGTFLGLLFLAIVNNALFMAGVSAYWHDIVNGAMLLMAVLVGESLRRRGRRN